MPIDKPDQDRFMNQVRVKLPGASDAGIKAQLFEVLDEFCDDSGAWVEQLSVQVLAGTPTSPNNTYRLVPQQGGTIIRLAAVFDPNNIPQPAFMPTGEAGTTEVGLLTLVNPVNTTQTMTVWVVKTVILPTTKDMWPDFDHTLFRRYLRYIIDGVTGKMMTEANKPYTSDKLGQYHMLRFREGIAIARAANERQNTVGAQAWSYPQGWRVKGQRGGVSTANPTQFF